MIENGAVSHEDDAAAQAAAQAATHNKKPPNNKKPLPFPLPHPIPPHVNTLHLPTEQRTSPYT